MPNWESFIQPEPAEFTDGWRDELDFDNWLVQGGGLEALGAVVGIAIDTDSASQQESVGRFAADVVTSDVDGNIVIIENQRYQTNHDHLGKILTYAGGLTNNTPECHLIWISEKVRDEHRAAIDWLNSRTDEKSNFFAVEIHLFRIDNKLMPSLELVCQPNNWSRNEQRLTALDSSEQFFVRFWQSVFEEFGKRENRAFLTRQRPPKGMWAAAGVGISHVHYGLVLTKTGCRVDCVISGGQKRKEYRDFMKLRLAGHRIDIENQYDETLEWIAFDEDGPQSKLQLELPIGDVSPSFDRKNYETWGELADWYFVEVHKLYDATFDILHEAKKAWDAGERDDLSEEDT